MAALLNWRPYHSWILVEDHAENKKLRLRGDTVGLVCTSMLNCCLDYPSVRYIFHLGAPRDATDYYQAISRCGRDGKPGYAIVYYDPGSLKKFCGDDLFGANVIYETLRDNTTCRQLHPGIFFDGVAVPCAMEPDSQLCDVCESQLSQSPPEMGPVRFPYHLMPDFELPQLSSNNGCHDGQSFTSPSTSNPLASTFWPCHTKLLTPSRNNPLNHPAPMASFGNHFAAAQASIKIPAKLSDEYL